jgi:phosphohistidine phosphatase
MLELALLRHAKAITQGAGLEDFDRPLAPRGRRDAARLAAALAPGAAFALVLCSPARRTRETLEALVPRLPASCELRWVPALYLAEAAQIAGELRGLAATPSVLVVGHNPGLHQFARWLAGEPATPEARSLEEAFPTAALARFQLRARSWSELAPERAELVGLTLPRDLRGRN